MSKKIYPTNDVHEKLEILVNEIEKPREVQELFEQCAKISDLFQFLDNLDENENTKTDSNLHEYTVKENETIIGLALSFNIKYTAFLLYLFLKSPKLIMEVNNFSNDEIFEGQKILIPIEKDKIISIEKFANQPNKKIDFEDLIFPQTSIGDESTFNFHEIIENSLLKKELVRNLNDQKEEEEINNKYFCYYCTSSGDIVGHLSLLNDSVRFEPYSGSLEKGVALIKNAQYNFVINLLDICEAFIINLPNSLCEKEANGDFNKDSLIQINLFKIGNSEIEKQYQDRLIVMRSQNTPFATIFLKMYDKNYNVLLKNQSKYGLANEIQKKLVSLMEAQKNETNLSINEIKTRVPFFDILYKEIFPQKLIKSSSANSKNILKNLNIFGVIPLDTNEKSLLNEKDETNNYIPDLLGPSNILTPDSFAKIWKHLPPILRLRHWKLSYSNVIHGISLNTLFNKCEDIGPIITIIKDFDDVIFGAYCTESWKKSIKFYGSGESFLFTFKGKQFICYGWSERNNCFQFSDSDGLAVGAGEDYGLFIHSGLLKGTTNNCDTYDNEILAGNKNFEIQFLEIWACDQFLKF